MLSTILYKLNSVNSRLNFTLEKEENNQIPFLDMLVIRNINNTIETNWYCKPISSNRILNFLSNHSRSMKINTAKSFAKRVIFLSHHKFHKENYKIIWNILTKNNYPAEVITRIIREIKHIQRTIPISPSIINNKENIFYKSMPFVKNLSKGFQRKLKNVSNIKLALKPNTTLRSIYTNTKDKYETIQKSNVIYKVNCNDCDNVYIGQTGKKLETRLKQHQQYVNKRSAHSALASHSLDHAHSFNFAEATILCSEPHRKKRETLEALHIYTTKNTVNLRTDTRTINYGYAPLLR